MGSLNGEACIMVSLSFSSRRGIRRKITDVNLTGLDMPETIEDLDMLLARSEEIICNLSNRSYTPELFKLSSPCLQSLQIEKENLNNEEKDIIDGLVISLMNAPKSTSKVK